MADLWKVLAVLTLLVVLLRRKVYFATVMLVGSLFLACLYLTPPAHFLEGVLRAVTATKTMEMTATLVFTMILENILRKTGTLKRMVGSLSTLLPDARLVMAAMPAMIGLLPSTGGAVFSAPMVKEAAVGLHIPADQKAFINYWYRHIWEYVSPLYPGIILVSGISSIPLQQLALANAPFALSVIFWGAVFCFRGIKDTGVVPTADTGKVRAFGTFIWTIAPILIALLLVVLLDANPALALAAVAAGLYLGHRYPLAQVYGSLRESISIKALLIVAGIVVFQETLQLTGALDGLSHYFSASGLPMLVIIFTIAFFAGLMTGLTIAFVGITFPILFPLMGGTPPDPGYLAFAFASGFAGVMLSPVHLCLVLSREYFGADAAKVYHRLLLPSALVFAAAVAPLYLMKW